jgi:hypothetical protein
MVRGIEKMKDRIRWARKDKGRAGDCQSLIWFDRLEESVKGPYRFFIFLKAPPFSPNASNFRRMSFCG